MKTEKIKALFSEDLKDFLIDSGEIEIIQKGIRFCKICGKSITLQNIQVIIPFRNKDFEYVCNSVSCVENYYE